MDSSPNSLVDPNARKNRVPSADEMITLRSLAQRNDEAMQFLDTRIEEGQNIRIALKRRYQELLESIESTQSEIIATERYLATLESQKSLVQDDNRKLKALMHPVRRCPTDVLQYLFEWAVEIEDNQPRSATTLAQVSRLWREVALRTPCLWRFINVTSKITQDNVQAFWSCAVERVRGAAAIVVFEALDPVDVHSKVISECQLDQIPNIKQLEFRMKTAETAEFLVSGSLHLPTGRVDTLQLQVEGKQEFSIDVVAIARRFSTAKSLKIYSAPQVTFSEGVVISTVTTLAISKVRNLSLWLLGCAFPNVSDVTFTLTTFDPSNTGRLIWPNLTRLAVLASPEMPWQLLMATNIIQVSCWGHINDHLIAFIASHKSLESLDIVDVEDNEDHISSILMNAPQLRSFTIDSCDIITDRTRMILSELTYLGVYDFEDDPVSLERFEKIVRSRFLPEHYKRESSDVKTPSLAIMVPGEPSEDREWQKSELIGSAHQQVSTNKIWGEVWATFIFQWE